jgi:hypothetical protein
LQGSSHARRPVDGIDGEPLFGSGISGGGLADRQLREFTSLPTHMAIKMVASLAAGFNRGIFAIDFAQAFLNAPVGNPDLHFELPILTGEIKSG